VLSSARRSQDIDALRAALDSAVEQIGEEITNLRALITELRPAALDELGLAPALDALVERMQTLHGFEISSTVKLARAAGVNKPRLDPDLETTIYRMVQESLTNAAKHAQADRLEVEVLELDDDVHVAVRDNGRGFDPDAPVSGFGLTGMRERIALAGGHLEINTSSDGTSIEAVFPVLQPVRATA
jgi:signal transduction histidine kinase